MTSSSASFFSSSPQMPLLALLFSLLLSSISAIHDGGFTWSNTPVPLPGATVDHISLTGPQSHIYQWQIYVLFKPPSSTQIMYMTWNWDTDRTWTTPIAIDNANSNSGGSVTEYYSQPVAIWVDATTNTLTFSIQNVNTLAWGQQMTSTYSAAQQPPNLFTPLTAEMFVFHRQHDSVAFGNCSYDGYSVFEDFPSGTNAYSHGSSAVNNRDPNSYIFYLGANADGTPTGYIHYMWQQQNTGYWSPDIQTRFTVDSDSTISAVPWGNNTSTYIFIFYKYQSNLYYAVLTDDYNHDGHFVPLSGNIGFPLGLTSDSGPTAVVYYDDYYSTQVVQLFYSKYDSPSGTYKVMNALGMPDSWP